MIYLYYGKIGDGKTYHVVANELLPAIEKGRKIYTNIDGLDTKYIAMYLGKLEKELNIVYIEHVEVWRELMSIESGDKEGTSLKVEKGSLIIIDEAQMIWDAREFRDTKKGFLSLLEYHRHFGLDIVFITQNPKRLESSITRLCNEAYQVKNLGFLGAFLRGRYVIHIRQTPHDRDIVSTIRGKYRPEIFRCYRSYVATSKLRKKTKGALQGFFYYATAIVMLLGFAMFIIRGGFTFADPKKVQSMASIKGVQNVGNDSQATVFVPNDNSSPGNVAVSSEKVPLGIAPLSDCERYLGIRGDGYIRRGNTVLYKRYDGVWTNIELDCGTEASDVPVPLDKNKT